MYKLFLLTTVFVIFAIKLIYLFGTNYTFYSDDAIYASLGKLLLTQGFFDVFHLTWPPMYPIFGAITNIVFGNYEISFRFVSLFSSILVIWPLYLLTKRYFSKFYQFFFLLSVLIILPMFDLSLLALSDILFSFLIILSLILTFLGINLKNNKLILYSSVTFGLSYLTRSEGAMFFYLTIIYLFLLLVLKKFNFSFLRMIMSFGILFIVTISSYLLFSYYSFGDFSLSHKFSAQIQQGHVFAFENNTTWAQEVVSVKNPNYKSKYFYNGTSFILNKFDVFMWLFKQKIQNWMNLFKLLFPWWSILFIVLGLFRVINRKIDYGLIYFVFIIVFSIPITIFSTAIAEIRYLLWSLPFLLFFIFLGVNNLSNLSPILKRMGIIFVLMIFSLKLFDFRIIDAKNYINDFNNLHYKQEVIDASNFINDQKITNPKIMLRHEAIEFYTNGETVYIPQTDLDSLIKYAKNKKVDYIVAWNIELEGDQELKELLSYDFKNPNLKLEKTFPQNNPKIYLYTLK